MSIDFRSPDYNERCLMPHSIQDWLPESHLARFIVMVVGMLELKSIVNTYAHGGKPAYCPRMMVALLFYGYATGIFSSRRLEAATYELVPMRFICGNMHPDHDTIAAFRKKHLKALDGLFLQILQIAHEMGEYKLGHVSLDGTKINANASKHRAMSWAHMLKIEDQLKEEVAKLLAYSEDEEKLKTCDLDLEAEIDLRNAKLSKIAEAKQRIEERAAERFEAENVAYEEKLQRRKAKEEATGKKAGGRPPKAPEPGPRPKDQVSFTDPDSRIMPTSGGFEQSYNAQATVDNDTHLIVGQHVSQATNDKQEMEPALAELAKAEEAMGQAEIILADTGYHSETNAQACEDEGIEPMIANGRTRHNQPLILEIGSEAADDDVSISDPEEATTESVADGDDATTNETVAGPEIETSAVPATASDPDIEDTAAPENISIPDDQETMTAEAEAAPEGEETPMPMMAQEVDREGSPAPETASHSEGRSPPEISSSGSEGSTASGRMAARMATPEGKSIYAKRKSTVEPVFGIIKHVLGFRQFHLRGLTSVQGEWSLVCMAWNLKRLHKLTT